MKTLFSLLAIVLTFTLSAQSFNITQVSGVTIPTYIIDVTPSYVPQVNVMNGLTGNISATWTFDVSTIQSVPVYNLPSIPQPSPTFDFSDGVLFAPYQWEAPVIINKGTPYTW